MNVQVIALVNQKGGVEIYKLCKSRSEIGPDQKEDPAGLPPLSFCQRCPFVAEGRDFSCFLHVRFLHKISIVPHLAFPTLFYWILTDAHTFFLLLRRIFLYLFDLSSDDDSQVDK